MSTYIPPVDNAPYINNAEFVKLTVYNNDNTTSIYTFSSSYKNEEIDGQVYLALGGLVGVGLQQRDIRVTSFDTSVVVSGIGEENIYVALGTKIKGSLIEIYRGFYNENYMLTDVVLRLNGIITSYNITQDFDTDSNDNNFSVTFNASSFKTLLENRVAGRQTSPNHWNEYSPPPTTIDTSVINVPNLINAYFDFGKPTSNKGT